MNYGPKNRAKDDVEKKEMATNKKKEKKNLVAKCANKHEHGSVTVSRQNSVLYIWTLNRFEYVNFTIRIKSSIYSIICNNWRIWAFKYGTRENHTTSLLSSSSYRKRSRVLVAHSYLFFFILVYLSQAFVYTYLHTLYVHTLAGWLFVQLKNCS